MGFMAGQLLLGKHETNMKKFALLALSPTLAFAGPPSADPIIEPVVAAEDWITPSLNVRARYEFADIDGSDASHALTFRERVGLQTLEWNGFSAFVEGEFSQALVDDYRGGAPGVTPNTAGNSVIADPETNELNRAYLQYTGYDTIVRLGRQRIIYDNAAFIGNVGWRQNEQTFDALNITNKSLPGFKVSYSYVTQVNRIFGSEAAGFFQDIQTDLHLLNGSYSGIEGLTLAGYAYLMDFEGANALDNDTFGGYVKTKRGGIDLHAELAFQIDAGPSGDIDSNYAHVFGSKKIGAHTFKAGFEYLSHGFRTPLATLHAFNGFADAFLIQRTFGNTGGLNDYYISHSTKLPLGVKMTNTLHAYGDNDVSASRGWEINSVFAKKFDEHFLAIAKIAHFESDGILPSTTRASIELNYNF